MDQLQLAAANLEDKRTALEAILAPLRNESGEGYKTAPTTEQNTEIKGLREEIKTAQTKFDELKTLAEADAENKKALEAQKASQAAAIAVVNSGTVATVKLTCPAVARKHRARYFKDDDSGTAEGKAYLMGMVALAAAGRSRSIKYVEEKVGLQVCNEDTGEVTPFRLHQENVNSGGGFLVPDILENDIIDLREQYGAFEPNARRSIMTSDTKRRPRRDSGLTAYYVGEAAQITESTKGWSQVQLVAKKLAFLTRFTTELSEDAIIDVGDDLAREGAYAFAKAIDNAGFNGDGTSTYGGITGVRAKLTGLSGTVANIAGLQVSTGTGYATNFNSMVLSDFEGVVSLLPAYADGAGAKWYVHRTFYWNTMMRLRLAAGGTTENMIALENGKDQMFLGYPVVWAQILPSTSATSQVTALFGNLALAADFGDRRQTTIAVSEHATVGGDSMFANDEVAMRGTMRYDIVVHDVGNASATASSRVPGPMVGLITASS